ncbi:uncharacterized protein LAESUDRAFT_657387 [Laetiporus sulphureus 93-53]|uniref:Uncharacterized protein n=1 Tax=Laetiporus sulphureus 93-53 TaxID=1314785 RepID=A0A165DDT3_9APHY|nr:uncharacterized protein LAESUDRAFT_657387 [Laetiporus sulphureus 93-53]KZT04658.1 hypothetical protein LAESUDRAFT_657387 [Laetiporus sulphureus 93-53]
MPQLLDCATPVKLSSITPEFTSRKLRVAGRMLAYIPETSMLLLADGHAALFVDISLCLNPHSSMPWLRERNSVIMAMGNLEESEHPFPLPILPLHARKSEIDPYLVLRAIVVTDSLTLDLRLWNKAIEEREKLAAASSAKRTTPSDIGSVR